MQFYALASYLLYCSKSGLHKIIISIPLHIPKFKFRTHLTLITRGLIFTEPNSKVNNKFWNDTAKSEQLWDWFILFYGEMSMESPMMVSINNSQP